MKLRSKPDLAADQQLLIDKLPFLTNAKTADDMATVSNTKPKHCTASPNKVLKVHSKVLVVEQNDKQNLQSNY